MIQQITDSIKYDDTSDYGQTPIDCLSGKQWLERYIQISKESIKYHEDKYKEEVDRAKGRTKWVKDLRNSLICAKINTIECESCNRRFNCYTINNYRY
jgi:hypothetical protein